MLLLLLSVVVDLERWAERVLVLLRDPVRDCWLLLHWLLLLPAAAALLLLAAAAGCTAAVCRWLVL